MVLEKLIGIEIEVISQWPMGPEEEDGKERLREREREREIESCLTGHFPRRTDGVLDLQKPLRRQFLFGV